MDKMVPMGRPGRLVSRDIPKDKRFTDSLAFSMLLLALLFVIWSILEKEPTPLVGAFSFIAFSALFMIGPIPRTSVHENGVVVRFPILEERFYPWAMFYHYWVYNDPEALEGHPTYYMLVLSASETIRIGHPMDDYTAAHGLIEQKLVWRSRPEGT